MKLRVLTILQFLFLLHTAVSIGLGSSTLSLLFDDSEVEHSTILETDSETDDAEEERETERDNCEFAALFTSTDEHINQSGSLLTNTAFIRISQSLYTSDQNRRRERPPAV